MSKGGTADAIPGTGPDSRSNWIQVTAFSQQGCDGAA